MISIRNLISFISGMDTRFSGMDTRFNKIEQRLLNLENKVGGSQQQPPSTSVPKLTNLNTEFGGPNMSEIIFIVKARGFRANESIIVYIDGTDFLHGIKTGPQIAAQSMADVSGYVEVKFIPFCNASMQYKVWVTGSLSGSTHASEITC